MICCDVAGLSSLHGESVGGVYAIINRINGKFYIGSTKTIVKRWKNHVSLLRRGKSSCRALQSAWNKYGEDAFEFLECEVVEPISKDALLACEQLHIDVLSPQYNVKRDAASPYEHHTSEQTRALISAAHKGHTRPPHPQSERARALISDKIRIAHAEGRMRAPKHTAETRAICAEAARAQHARQTPEERAEMCAKMRRGKAKTVSAETREKLRQANFRRYAAMTKDERLAHTAAMRIAVNGHA